MDVLPTVWFIAIAALWIGYLLLEGFDLGVGMHMLVTAKSETQRRVMLNTIGPVWDGNERWLITAGAATFAAFPFWYASLFSALYVPLTLVLLGLIFRAVAIKYRGKGSSERWTRNWDLALGLGSFVVAFGVGAMLTLTTTGLPLNENGDRVGGAFAWLNGYAVLGGLAVVEFCLVHASTLLALKSDGTVWASAGRWFTRWTPVALLPIVGWVLVVQVQTGPSSPGRSSSLPSSPFSGGTSTDASGGRGARSSASPSSSWPAPRRSLRRSSRSCCRRPSTTRSS